MNPIYTAEEVLEAFEAHQDKLDDPLDEIFYDGPSTWKFKHNEKGDLIPTTDESGYRTYEKIDVPFLLRGVPTEVSIAEQTGGMDEGSNASITFQIGSQYFRKDGYYASHYGYEWDGAFYEVRPKRVTVTQFERV